MAGETGLKKSITWLEGTAMTIGAVIGAGVLALPAVAAVAAGPASLLTWSLTGLITLPMLIAIAGMSSRYPNSGGMAAYAQQAFGPGMGRLSGFLVLIAMPIGAPPTLIIGANYLGGIFGWSSGAVHLLTAVMCVATVAVNYRGIEISGRTQVVVVSAILGIMLFVVFSALPEVRASEFRPFFPAGIAPVGREMSLIFFAYLGWEMIGHLAEEFRSPRRDIPVSLGIAFVVVNVVYLAVALVVVGTGVYKTGNPSVALATLVGGRYGATAANLVSVLGCFVCFCPIITYVAGFSRLAYALARDGYLPKRLGELHPRWHTPVNALLAITPVLLGITFASWAFSIDLNPLLSIPSATFLLVYVIGMFSAAKVLPTRTGRAAGFLGGLLSLFVFLMSGWYMALPLAVTLFFVIRYRKDFIGLPRDREAGR